jgi:uncharacterized membrane protein
MNTPAAYPSPGRRPAWRTRFIGTPLGWLTTLALAALGAYLLVFHLNHTLLVVPYLLLMACPLMHLFMHHGHHHGGKDD